MSTSLSRWGVLTFPACEEKRNKRGNNRPFHGRMMCSHLSGNGLLIVAIFGGGVIEFLCNVKVVNLTSFF